MEGGRHGGSEGGREGTIRSIRLNSTKLSKILPGGVWRSGGSRKINQNHLFFIHSAMFIKNNNKTNCFSTLLLQSKFGLTMCICSRFDRALERTSGLSTTRVENSISGQMGYSQHIASPLPDAQTVLQFEFGGAARHVVVRPLWDRWSAHQA